MRKNIFLFAVLLCGAFSLAAQTSPNASVYVPPVAGNGSKPDDNSLFYKQLVDELTGQNFNLAKAQDGADYSLIATLARDTGSEGQFVFHLGLQDNKTRIITVEGELLYLTAGDTNQLFPVLVRSLLYTIPVDMAVIADTKETAETANAADIEYAADAIKNDDWRNKFLYIGAAVTWTPHIYTWEIAKDTKKYNKIPNFTNYPLPLGVSGAISAEVQFLDFLSFETGAGLAFDRFSNGGNTYYNTFLEIPVLLKYVFKPGTDFMLEPYLGAHINLPIVSHTFNTSLLSGMFGFQFGVKVGPGVLFADVRAGGDIFNSTVKAPSGGGPSEYHRYIAHIGLGYKFGFFQR